MYSKKEAAALKQEFWTAFGRYMQPVLSAGGEKANWINYKTGARHIYFRMEATKGAIISIELLHSDEEQRTAHYNKLMQLSALLHQSLNEEWTWEEFFKDEHGKTISRIYTQLHGVNIFNRADWPSLISFFKPRIIALDEFWNNVKHEFDVW